MICPKCGARDVVSTSVPEQKIHKAECLHCEYEWDLPADPYGKAAAKAAGDLDG